MYQKFYHNTLQSNFIKYLLQNTYIPTVPFTSNINHVTKDSLYIHENYFVKAKKSEDMVQIQTDIFQNPKKYSEYFDKFEPYIFGRRYIGLTTNYVSNTDIYDPETHFYLAQYLKAYKAHYGIDLFPYYNCFSDEYLSDISLEKLDDMPYIDVKYKRDDNYKIISVPISLCQEYTIVLDCSTEVLMTPVFLGKKGILKEQTNVLRSALMVAPHEQVHLRTNYIQPQCSFKKPIYFQSPCIPGMYDKAQLALTQYEKYLRLLIKIPASNTSSIVVMQGHHSNLNEQQDRLINLSMEDVRDYINQVSEKDLTPGIYNSLNNTEIHYYGNPRSILSIYPNNLVSVVNSIEKSDSDAYISDTFIKEYIPCLSNGDGDDLLGFNIVKDSIITSSLVKTDSTVVNNAMIDLTHDFNNKIVQIRGSGITLLIDDQDIKSLDSSITFKSDTWTDPLYLQAAQKIVLQLNFTSYDSKFEIISDTNCLKVQQPNFAGGEKFYKQTYFEYQLNSENILWDKVNTLETVPMILDSASNIKVSIKDIDKLVIQNSSWIQYIQQSNTADETDYLNKYLHNNLSLIYLNDSISYAFTSRLIEYLVNNVISNTDRFIKDIKTTQENLSISNSDLNINIDGVWKPVLRIAAFEAANNWRNYLDLPNLRDINGFIDKDSEVAIHNYSSYLKKLSKSDAVANM